jgi:hypothetical protein
VPKAAGEPAPTPLPVNEQPQEPRNVPTPIVGDVPGTFADPDLAKMFGGQEAAAHKALVFMKWLTESDPLSALRENRVAQIKARPGAFAAAAKLTLNQGAA